MPDHRGGAGGVQPRRPATSHFKAPHATTVCTGPRSARAATARSAPSETLRMTPCGDGSVAPVEGKAEIGCSPTRCPPTRPPAPPPRGSRASASSSAERPRTTHGSTAAASAHRAAPSSNATLSRCSQPRGRCSPRTRPAAARRDAATSSRGPPAGRGSASGRAGRRARGRRPRGRRGRARAQAGRQASGVRAGAPAAPAAAPRRGRASATPGWPAAICQTHAAIVAAIHARRVAVSQPAGSGCSSTGVLPRSLHLRRKQWGAPPGLSSADRARARRAARAAFRAARDRPRAHGRAPA